MCAKYGRLLMPALFYGAGVLSPAFSVPLPWPVQNVNSFDPTGDVVYVNTGDTVTQEGHYRYESDNIQIQAVSVLNTNVLQATLVPDGGTTNVTLTALQAGVSAVKLSGLYFDWSVENPDHTWGALVTNTISYGVLVCTASGVPPGLPTDYTPIGSRAIMGNNTVEQWYQGGTNGTIDARRTDVIDIYMEGGPCSWVYQNSDWDVNWYPGKYLYQFIRGCKRQGRIPCVVFYCIPPSGVGDSALGALKSVNESADVVASDINRFGGDPSNPWCPTNKVAAPNYMVSYYHRTIRLMRECLQRTTGDGWPCLVVIEPDFIGYMSANLGEPVDPNSTNIAYNSNNYTFKVSRAFEQGPSETNTVGTNIYTYSTNALLDIGDQAQFHNTLKGFVTSIPYIFRKAFELNGANVQLGANVMIGWKLNLWASKSGTGYSGQVLKPTGTPFGVGKGIIRWTDAENQGASPNSFGNIIEWLREEAAGIAGYYISVGITNNTDYLFIDRYGIDAASAGYVTDPASSTWFWNYDHWNNYLAFVESVQQQVQLPIILWQLPMGHINTTETKKTDGTAYTSLSNQANSGSFEDSSATFWFGDTFTPGSADRLAYFSANQWGGYDPSRVADVTVTGNKIIWLPAIDRLKALNIAALLSGPGVGRSASTFACAVDTAESTDNFWWINQVQRYYLGLGRTYEVYADFDGDSKSDLAVYCDGHWSIFSMVNGIILLNEGVWGVPNSTPLPGDYDGDGKSDLAVYCDGYWSIFSMVNGIILLNEGVWGGPGWIPVPGDYDGDDKFDLAVYSCDGYWSICSLANGIILNNEGVWGGQNYIPVPGDYDGDGKSDLAVYCDGYWSIYSLANGIILLNEGVWGGAGWNPVPGDFDGDKKSDLAVYRDGYWSIYSLANGIILNNEGVWGGPDWTPVPGDFDGDKKSDLAVYSCDGYWSIFSMVNGIILLNEGVWGGPGWITIH
ncbi:MAG: VCBS repeat-containing protein [Verrucomicrobiota bacterium]